MMRTGRVGIVLGGGRRAECQQQSRNGWQPQRESGNCATRSAFF